MSPGDFCVVRGCMNQTSAESCQMHGTCKQQQKNVYGGRRRKARAGVAAGEQPSSFVGYWWSR